MDFDHPFTSPASRRAVASSANNVRMARASLSSLSGEALLSVILGAISGNSEVSAQQLDRLANLIGRVAHEKARKDV
jgi:hypothetical protein